MGCDVIPIRIQPKSDQINADDLPAGLTLLAVVTDVRPGPDDNQAVDVVLAGHGRVYRPCLTMRRVLVACWGGVTDGQLDPSAWIGKRLELYTDPTVRFGSDLTGGLRIRALSGIKKPYSVAVTVTRGKRATYTVHVLPAAASTATTLPKFVSAVAGLASGLTVPRLQEYLMESGVDIALLAAADLSAIVADLRTPDESARLRAWLDAATTDGDAGAAE